MKLFEPDTGYFVENGDNKGQAIISIAVSLKRIADALEGSPSQVSLVTGIQLAISQGLYEGRRP